MKFIITGDWIFLYSQYSRIVSVYNLFFSSFQDQLFTKRDKLAEQLTEAKKLKQNIDKRSSTVSRILQKYLSEEQFSSYQTFIKTKTKLIIETRIINDKIALSEEQLNALKE